MQCLLQNSKKKVSKDEYEYDIEKETINFDYNSVSAKIGAPNSLKIKVRYN